MVVAVRTEHCELHTKTTKGQYSSVRLEQARLVSSLLYGTRLMLFFSFKMHFLQLDSKDFWHVITQATQKEHDFKSNIRTSYRHNLQSFFLVWEPKCGDNVTSTHHTILSAIGLEPAEI